jgi:hypothetical protein
MVIKEPTKFTFTAKGHVNIRATHPSTFEITTEPHLTPKGDCIIGVEASHSALELNQLAGDNLRTPTSEIQTFLSVDGITECIWGNGSPQLTLSNKISLVWRTSDFVDDRTIAINCDKAAKDLNPILISKLRNPGSILEVTFFVF